MTVNIGIGLFTAQLPEGSPRTFAQEYRETVDLVRLAETVGFDAAWVSEHHGASDGYLPSLLPLLGAFAAATDRIELGTGVVLAPLHDPIRLAEDAAVVDNLCDGRLLLGLAMGWRKEEFRMMRVPFEQRRVRLEETVDVLRHAWTGRRFSFSGEIFDYDRVRVTPPPARAGGPPILLGGYVDAALDRAGRLADGYITDAGVLDELVESVGSVERAAIAAGRDPSAISLALLQNAFVSDEDGAWQVARAGVAHQLGSYLAWAEDADTPEHDAMQIPDQTDADLRAWTAAGTPEEVTVALRPFVESFAHGRDLHLIVRLHYPGMNSATASRAIELFGERVIPALKSA
ncbi:MAG: LLM class flavin-dependent oxidoreductase [Actinomycetota bacterium]